MTQLSERDLKLVGGVLPGNSSLTNFTDFRCSHDDLAALLDAARQEGAPAAEDVQQRLMKALKIWHVAHETGRNEPLQIARDHGRRLVASLVLDAPHQPAAEVGELKADFLRSLPGGSLDDAAYQAIEDALDRADAPCRAPDGRWLKLHERVAALTPPAPAAEPMKMLVDSDWLTRHVETDPDLDAEVVPVRQEIREEEGSSVAGVQAAPDGATGGPLSDGGEG